MKVYFATWLYEPAQKESLDKKGGQNRLLSYFFLDQEKMSLQEYVENPKEERLDEGKKRRTFGSSI